MGFVSLQDKKEFLLITQHYFIDLVFYNAILKCYVVIDLKTDKLSHEALGQIDLYRNYFDKEIKSKDDNPTIGLLLVTQQDTLVAKYSSIYKDQNIFVSKYANESTGEFIAECFANASLCSNPSPYAVEVLETLKQYFGK